MGICNVRRRFALLCRDLKLCIQANVAIDSSKFKAVNSRDCTFTPGKVGRRQQQISAPLTVSLPKGNLSVIWPGC